MTEITKTYIKKRDPSGNTIEKLQKLVSRKEILVEIHYRNYKNFYQEKRS